MSFLTGSRKYGAPTPKSDIDMVVRTDDKQLVQLLRAASQTTSEESEHLTPVRFGMLNLILCTSDEAYEAWVRGTHKLARRAEKTGPIKRDKAIRVMRKIREQLGIFDWGYK